MVGTRQGIPKLYKVGGGSRIRGGEIERYTCYAIKRGLYICMFVFQLRECTVISAVSRVIVI